MSPYRTLAPVPAARVTARDRLRRWLPASLDAFGDSRWLRRLRGGHWELVPAWTFRGPPFATRAVAIARWQRVPACKRAVPGDVYECEEWP